jgi:DNA invertase Pin-like site-specific DNA recombinase
MIIGYARVSTDGQSLEAQQAALKAAGAERIFAEKISGAITDRKALAQAIKALGNGDVLLVTRLDRLARSTRDLLNILDQISKAGAKFKSLADAWADTSTIHGELMVTILAGLATFERHLIRARTDEGRKRAQARGVRFGRPLKLSRYQIDEALARLGNFLRTLATPEPIKDWSLTSLKEKLIKIGAKVVSHVPRPMAQHSP